MSSLNKIQPQQQQQQINCPLSALELTAEDEELENFEKVPSDTKIPKTDDLSSEPPEVKNKNSVAKFIEDEKPSGRIHSKSEISPHYFADGQIDWNMDDSTPPLAAKTEEKVRGNAFKVSTIQ